MRTRQRPRLAGLGHSSDSAYSSKQTSLSGCPFNLRYKLTMNVASLSVILPNYNHALFLEKTLKDMLKQSFQPKEIIIIDDGSTDGSVEIIEEIVKANSIVKLLRNETNKGIFYSTSRALDLSSGEYIYFAGADDLIYPGFFEESMFLLGCFQHAGLCSSVVESLEPHGVRIKSYANNISQKECYILPNECIQLLHRRGNWMGGCTTIYRREAYFDAGGFNEKLGSHCDTFLQMVVALKYGVCFIPKCMGAQRLYESSYSATISANLEANIKIYSEAANLMRTTYKALFPSEFINSWEAREVSRARLSTLQRLRRQEPVVVKSLFNRDCPVDRLLIWGLILGGYGRSIIILAYCLIRGDKELRHAVISLTRIAIRRIMQRIEKYVFYSDSDVH